MGKTLKDIEQGNTSKTGKSRQFYTLKELSETRIYTCTLCEKQINATKASNLVVHIELCHKDIYETKVKFQDKKSLIHLREKRFRLLQSCVKKTTIDHESFSAILKASFQEIIANKLRKFQEAGIPLNLTDKNLMVVKEHIHKTADKIRKKIKEETKDKLISLSVDGASKHRRSVLGIGAQYIHDKKFTIRMLGLKELTDSHTGIYLSSVVRECLTEYGCEMDQVIAVTTDNGSNMIKMAKELSVEDELEQNSNDYHDQPISVNVNEHLPIDYDEASCDTEIERLLKQISEMEIEEINALLDDTSEDDEPDFYINPGDIQTSAMFKNHVNCAAHTIQLVVSDSLKELGKDHKNVIEICRAFAKLLRRPNIIVKLKQLGIKIKLPKLDCSTRWNSTYLMVNKSLIIIHPIYH